MLSMIDKWKGVEFPSSSGTTALFSSFVRDFKKYLTKNLPKGGEVTKFFKGHFYVCGFIKVGEKYVYFSISDVRFNMDDWHKRVLIRTAKDDLDYSGGGNNFTTLENFKESVEKLLQRGCC
jgi:hypothetical protein